MRTTRTQSKMENDNNNNKEEEEESFSYLKNISSSIASSNEHLISRILNRELDVTRTGLKVKKRTQLR